jgi:hypothetical protein
MKEPSEKIKEIENPYAKGCGMPIGYDRGDCKEGNICDTCLTKGLVWLEGYEQREKEIIKLIEEFENKVDKEKKRLFKLSDKYEKEGNKEDMRKARSAGFTLGINIRQLIGELKAEIKGARK